MDISFVELRCKEVVNTINGKRMGRVIDIVISCKSCRVLGIVVPGQRHLFKCNEDFFIPWRNICKIGDDVILVEFHDGPYNKSCKPNKNDDDKDEHTYRIEDYED